MWMYDKRRGRNVHTYCVEEIVLPSRFENWLRVRKMGENVIPRNMTMPLLLTAVAVTGLCAVLVVRWCLCM